MTVEAPSLENFNTLAGAKRKLSVRNCKRGGPQLSPCSLLGGTP